MGIASTVNKWTYVLDGETLIFPYTTKIFAQTDLVVQIVGTTTTTLTLTTDYSVSGTGEDSGGNVTLVSAGSSGDKLVIRKVLPLTQTTDLVENDPNRADVMENALDRMVLIAQQIDENVQRAVVRDVTQTTQVTLPTPSADKLIGWDSAGTGLENKTALDTDVQTACETAQTAAETAQGLAEDARDAAALSAIAAQESAEAAELIADLEVASQADAEAGTNNAKMMTPLRTAQAITALALEIVYPVGIVVTLGVATNPGTLFGVGTWAQIKGRVICGKADSGTFDTLNATMGAETHTLTTAQIPAHTHTNNVITLSGSQINSTGDPGSGTRHEGANSSNRATGLTSSTGGGGAHNNIQPTIVKYVWERVS
jgi:hypothetical protein